MERRRRLVPAGPAARGMHVPVAVEIRAVIEISTSRTPAQPRSRIREAPLVIPVETFQITTGIKGGIAGGIAMTVPAGIFSLLKYHSFWYATNLLAAGGFVSWIGRERPVPGPVPPAGSTRRSGIIHGLTSLLVGLLYGAMLPMFPRYPILTAGARGADHVHRRSCTRHRSDQPDPEPAHRLVLVLHLADRLRVGLRLCGEPAYQGAYAAVPRASLRGARRSAHRQLSCDSRPPQRAGDRERPSQQNDKDAQQ